MSLFSCVLVLDCRARPGATTEGIFRIAGSTKEKDRLFRSMIVEGMFQYNDLSMHLFIIILVSFVLLHMFYLALFRLILFVVDLPPHEAAGPQMLNVADARIDVNVVASVFKQMMRCCPESILTNAAFDKFIKNAGGTRLCLCMFLLRL
jgi:hypothetical protein